MSRNRHKNRHMQLVNIIFKKETYSLNTLKEISIAKASYMALPNAEHTLSLNWKHTITS
jgi:hypothetical protein